MWRDVFKKTPWLCDLKPGGKYVAKDMGEAGGMPMLLRVLLDAGIIHGDCHDCHRQDDARKSRSALLAMQIKTSSGR